MRPDSFDSVKSDYCNGNSTMAYTRGVRVDYSTGSHFVFSDYFDFSANTLDSAVTVIEQTQS